jgi:tol-pal system protein YbgF
VNDDKFVYLNDQVVALDKRVDNVEASVDKQLSSELGSIRENQAETGEEIDKIREELQALSGRVEENAYLVKRTVERDIPAQDGTTMRSGDLDARISQLESDIKRIYAHLQLKSSGNTTKQVGKKSPAAEKQAAKSPAREVKQVSPEKGLYESTLSLYRDKRYDDAISAFEDFLQKYPKSSLADNAQFWIGESYMGLDQYEQAILAYQKVIKNYPQGNKVPGAILRQAMAFEEINDKTSAKLLLKKIIKKYPKSSEAKTAKAKLKAMK